MHEELVKKLRYCGNAVSCLHCPYWEGCGGSKEDLVKAANAIDDLDAINQFQLEDIAELSKERKIGCWDGVSSYELFGGDYVAWAIRGNPIAEYYCSECKKAPLLNEDGDTILSKYCPSCGAVMRNGGDEDV